MKHLGFLVALLQVVVELVSIVYGTVIMENVGKELTVEVCARNM